MVTGRSERRHGLSRRDFLVLGGGAAATAALSACAPSAGAPTKTPASAAPTPRAGGTLNWAHVTEIPSVDPALTVGAGDDLIGNMFDSLVSIDADGNVHPWLATKWTMENDARKFTFTLRDDVKFHDGTLLDSTAVKRTLERVADPRTKGGQSAVFLGPLDHAEAPDPRTVILVFKDSTPLLLLNLWRQRLGIISPKQLDTIRPGDQITDAPIGSGPYRWAGRSSDGVITMTRNPDYRWGPEFKRNRGAAYFDAIKMRRIAEASTRTATLESGESLLVDDLSDADYARLKSDKRFAFVQVPRKGPGYGFLFNTKKGPASDLAVRQAMNWAVDRQAIVDKLLFGVHHPLVGPLTEGVWGRLDDLEKTIPYSGDKKKAADMLEAAGWRMGAGGIREKGGQRLSMLLAQNAGVYPSNDLGAALQLQVREIGIDLRLQQMPSANWLDFVRSYKHDMCDTRGTNFDPDELRGRFGSSGIGTLNYTNLTDAQLDAALAKGQLAPLGSDARRQAYADVQRRIIELAAVIPLITPIRTYGMTSRLHEVQGDATGANAFPMTDPWLES
jgi:peptide/nickel transport system substrate-binding protein